MELIAIRKKIGCNGTKTETNPNSILAISSKQQEMRSILFEVYWKIVLTFDQYAENALEMLYSLD